MKVTISILAVILCVTMFGDEVMSARIGCKQTTMGSKFFVSFEKNNNYYKNLIFFLQELTPFYKTKYCFKNCDPYRMYAAIYDQRYNYHAISFILSLNYRNYRSANILLLVWKLLNLIVHKLERLIIGMKNFHQQER